MVTQSCHTQMSLIPVESQNKDKFRPMCTNGPVNCAGCEASSCHIVITNKINSSPFSRWALLPWCCSARAPANSDQQNPIGKMNVQSGAVIRADCCLRKDFLVNISFWERLSPGHSRANKRNPQTAMMGALRVQGAGAQEISELLYFSSNSGTAQWFTPVINCSTPVSY